MHIRVINGTKEGFHGNHKHYIGRENKFYRLSRSALANSYLIDKHSDCPQSDRSKVIELYRRWLWQQIKEWKDTGNTTPAIKELLDLVKYVQAGNSLTLTCWCHPLPCHGDVIARCISWLISQQ